MSEYHYQIELILDELRKIRELLTPPAISAGSTIQMTREQTEKFQEEFLREMEKKRNFQLRPFRDEE